MNDAEFAPARAAELRRSFDRTFAQSAHLRTAPAEDFLALRIGGDPYAVRLLETAGIYAGRKIVPLPARLIELHGIAALRGLIVPVYDFAALLGYGSSGPGRWLLLARGPEPVGFSFAGFEGHFRVARQDLIAREETASARRYVRELAPGCGSVSRPVVSLVSLAETIKKRISAAGSEEGDTFNGS